MRTPPQYCVLNEVFALATQWAEQVTDYDEDTERQIEDGRAILAIYKQHNLPADPPAFDLERTASE